MWDVELACRKGGGGAEIASAIIPSVLSQMTDDNPGTKPPLFDFFKLGEFFIEVHCHIALCSLLNQS